MEVYRLLTSKWARKVWRLDRQRRRFVADSDCVVVSFPKSGKTWLRALLTEIYSAEYSVANRLLIQHDNLHRVNAGIPKIFFTHDCDPLGRVEDLRTDKSEYAGRKVVVLLRNPCDVAVSHYYQLKHRVSGKRENATQGLGLFDFVAEPGRGIEYIIRYMNSWHRFAAGNTHALVIRYENLLTEPELTLLRLSAFLGKTFSRSRIERATALCTFDRLQQRERERYYDDKALRPADPTDINSFKVRRGKINGYKEDLTPFQAKRLEAIALKLLDPEIGYGAISEVARRA